MLQFYDPKQTIVQNPLIVRKETDLKEVINLMIQARSSQCYLPSSNSPTTGNSASCVLVMSDKQVLGIVTERDLVKLAAQGKKLVDIQVTEVMTRQVITLKISEFKDVFTPLSLLREYRIRHLPIVDDQGDILGIVTPESLRQTLRSTDLLRFRQVQEVMGSQVIHAPSTASVLELAKLMAEYRVSCVVIAEASEQKTSQIPVGIVTEQDIVQFQALEINLQKTQATTVMSTPLFCLRPEDSLWLAHQQMQKLRVQRLVVAGTEGELIGIITQTSLLQILNPVEMYGVLEILQRKVLQLEAEKVQLLESRNAELEREVQQRTAELKKSAERERLLGNLAFRIRASLNLSETLDTIVKEVRGFLKCDRVSIYQFETDSSFVVVAESVSAGKDSFLGRTFQDLCFASEWITSYTNGRILVVSDIYQAEISPCHRSLLESFQLRAKILVPIMEGEKLWGLLSASESNHPRDWQSTEVSLLEQLSTQIAIAIQQAKAYHKSQAELAERLQAELALQQFNAELEARVKQRTAALQESEERYHSLVEGASDAILLADIQGNLLEVNQKAEELFGYTREELTQLSVAQIHPKEELSRVFAVFSDIIEKKSGKILDTLVLRKDGSRVPVDITGSMIELSGRQLVQGIFRDVSDRKLAEAEFLALTSLQQAIFDSADYSIIATTSEGIIKTFNAAAQRMLGYDPEEVIGKATPAIIHDLEELKQKAELLSKEFGRLIVPGFEVFVAKARQGITNEEEWTYIRKDGSRFPVSLSITALRDPQGNITGFLGIGKDITQQKQADEQLRRTLKDLSNLKYALDQAAIVAITDARGVITYVNDIFCEISQYSREELIGKTHKILNSGYHSQEFFAELWSTISSGQVWRGEIKNKAKDGTYYWVDSTIIPFLDDQGKPVQYLAIRTDITQRKQAEESLKRQLAAVEAAIDGIAILENNCYTYLNKAHVTLFGYEKAEELIGKTWKEVYSPEEIARIEQEIFPIIMQQHHWQGEATATRKDGTTFAEEVSLTVNEDGDLICVCRDINDRKLGEAKLKNTNEQLILTNAELARATRLKDEFLANMSHELRTPLNAILGMSEGLQEQVFGSLNERQQKAIATIERSGRHLLELINDILDLSKIESGKLELQISEVSVTSLCESSLTFVKQIAMKKNIKLNLQISQEIGSIHVDNRRIRQVLINLLSNAVKFTPEGGNVTLEVRLESDKAMQKSPSQILFSVKDTGIGIAPEDMDKLFQSFVQIDSSLSRQYTGTGLGLSLVRRMVELHGGSVTVESEIGKGSCFTVKLPYQQKQQVTISQAPVVFPSCTLPINNFQVLVIEDSIAASDQIVRYLNEVKMQVIVYPRGEGAIEEALRIQPALIILDIQLPKLSGWEVLTQLKAHPQTKNIPVLIVSVVDERSKGICLGAAEYLIKPITREQLRTTIDKLRQPNWETYTSLMVVREKSEPESPLILLAEDNQANIDTISDYLTCRGYQLVIAKNGQEAINIAKAEKPDLILMDIQMPGMDGMEATRQIRSESELARIPIIALTALAMTGDREKCLAAGANEYLTKPIKLKQLANTIKQFLQR